MRPKTKRPLVAVIRFADRLAYELPNSDRSTEEMLSEFVLDPAAAYLGLSHADLHELWVDLVDLCDADNQILAA